MSATDNETNAMWREVKGEVRAHRDAVEPMRHGRLARYVVAGLMDATPLGEFGWRITAKGQRVDYWPRTSRWREPTGKAEGRGWIGVLKYLGITERVKWPQGGNPT